MGYLKASQPGCFEYDGERRLVKCPWHGGSSISRRGSPGSIPRGAGFARFVSASGRSLLDGDSDVSLEAGGPDAGPADSASDAFGLVAGPYTAQTVPISVEDDYVIVEL